MSENKSEQIQYYSHNKSDSKVAALSSLKDPKWTHYLVCTSTMCGEAGSTIWKEIGGN